jgi:hypothetical protein
MIHEQATPGNFGSRLHGMRTNELYLIGFKNNWKPKMCWSDGSPQSPPAFPVNVNCLDLAFSARLGLGMNAISKLI